MKKLITILVMVSILCGMVFATDNYSQVATMIDKKLSDESVDAIQKLSGSLSGEEKALLYQQHACEKTLPFVLNLAVGCGIGSYVQGDTKGGTTALITELAGVSILGIGYVDLLNKALDNKASSSYGFDLGLIYAGVACMMAGRVYECIRPFTYANQYNERLNSALNGGPSIAVVPTSVNGQVGTSVVGSVSF